MHRSVHALANASRQHGVCREWCLGTPKYAVLQIGYRQCACELRLGVAPARRAAAYGWVAGARLSAIPLSTFKPCASA